MNIDKLKEFELERPDFRKHKEMLFNYIKSDNIFSFNQDGYELSLYLYNKNFIKLQFESQSPKADLFIFVNKLGNKKDKDYITHQSYRNQNIISIKTEKKGKEYHLFKNPTDNLEYIKLGDEYNILEILRNDLFKVSEVLKLVDKESNNKEIQFFLSNINKKNIDSYINLIKKNNSNINELLIYTNEIHKLGFDVFNLSKEDIEVIELNTDIKCTIKIPEKNKVGNSFFKKIKNIFNK